MPKPASAEQPSFAGLSLANGDYVVLRLQDVGSAGAELGAEELAMYRRFLASRSGQQDFQAFQRQLREQAEIERF